jgi:lipopolysaccharide/colanic/teichoic acid biosynthesis glycosyltransferase
MSGSSGELALEPPASGHGVPLVEPLREQVEPRSARTLRAAGRIANAATIRAFDMVVAGVLLLLLLPVIVVVALLVRLDSPGPAFFRCRRVGYRGRDLMMLKFRKMHDDARGTALTMDDDQRFTRIGIYLSKFKLDEIPQLWHVLRGQMSLVGPRPEDPGFAAHHPDEFERIAETRPGIIGLSQIAFIEESRILSDEEPLQHYLEQILPQKVKLDLLYVERRSVWFNVRILFWGTIAVITRRNVAVHRASGRMNLRRR